MAVVADVLEKEAGAGPPHEPADGRRLGLEQLLVAAGQVGSGVGNLAFALVAARILDPAGFAQLSVFLGLYLVLSLPAASLSAATALEPGRRNALVRRVVAASAGVALIGAALSPLIGPVLHLPAAMIVILAAVVPAAGALALDRGRLYGRQLHGRVVASLAAEPAVRLTLGLVLATWTGALGGAAGVVIAAYAALEVARAPRRRTRPGLHSRPGSQPAGGAARRAAAPATAAGWTAGAFALLAVVQNQDLIFANARLAGHQAGIYAALSTLGGAAAFATITIPMVLLPRAAKGERHSLAAALGAAALIGLAAVGVGAAAPAELVRMCFGPHYVAVSHLVVPYLVAMGLLGVARVLVAARCATGGARAVTVLTGVAAAGQAAVLSTVARGVEGVAYSTLATTAALTAALGAERLVRRYRLAPRAVAALRSAAVTRRYQLLAAVVLVGLVVRLLVWRGLWLDEATSVHQVHMSFGGMITNLRDTDVHPPLYFTLLWVTVRIFGYGSMAIRIPSIVAGLLVVPACYVAGRDLWDRRTGMVAAAFASVGPLLVWYSQEVRMYSLFMLFAVLAIWGQARALRRGRPADWAIYVLASAGLAWTEYFGLFQVLAQQLFFLWLFLRHPDQRARLVGWVVATAAFLALFAPLAPFAWHQFLVNQNAGKGFGAPSQTNLAGTGSISVYTVLANLVWAAVGYHSAPIMKRLVALWPLGILATLFVLGRRSTWATRLVAVCVVVPAALLLAAGMEKRFLYDVRYMSGVAAALVLLGARLLTGSSRSRRLQLVGCVAVVAALLAGLGDEQLNGTNPRLYDFRGALKSVNAQWRAGDVLVYAPSDIQTVIAYYSPQARAVSPAARLPEVPEGGTIFVLASRPLMNASGPAQLRHLLVDLRSADVAAGVVRRSNVTVWKFLVPAPGTVVRGGVAVRAAGSGR